MRGCTEEGIVVEGIIPYDLGDGFFVEPEALRRAIAEWEQRKEPIRLIHKEANDDGK